MDQESRDIVASMRKGLARLQVKREVQMSRVRNIVKARGSEKEVIEANTLMDRYDAEVKIVMSGGSAEGLNNLYEELEKITQDASNSDIN